MIRHYAAIGAEELKGFEETSRDCSPRDDVGMSGFEGYFVSLCLARWKVRASFLADRISDMCADQV